MKAQPNSLRPNGTRQVPAILAVLTVVVVSGCGSTSTPPAPTPEPIPVAVSQTQLAPPSYTVTVDAAAGEPGDVFLTTGLDVGAVAAAVDRPASGTHPRPESTPGATEIVDRSGRPIWFGQLPKGLSAMNFQAQTYHGQPVLTWSQCAGLLTNCTTYVADSSYRIIATVTLGDGFELDSHEFRLTPDGHALVIATKNVPADLTPVGGPKEGTAQDAVAMEIDVATNRVIRRWDSSTHVPIADSELTFAASAKSSVTGGAFDAYHMNSVALGPNGDWIVSMRNTSAVYDVDPGTGKVIWQLGGRRPTLAAGPGVQFSFQHDAQFAAADTVRLFNDDNSEPNFKAPSSIEWIHVDPAARAATLVRTQTHPGELAAWATGNAQATEGGRTFGSWGTTGHLSEFSPSGQMIYDVELPGSTSYRAFLAPWVGHPTWNPELTVSNEGVHAVWNGATEVRRWRLLTGTETDLRPVATVDWNGLNTLIPLPADAPKTGYFVIEALDVEGSVIGRSRPTQG